MESGEVFVLHSFLMGIQIAAVYDVLRILRRVISHRASLVALEDVLFWIGTAVEVFLLLYRENNGQLRWYTVLAAGLGLFLYERLLGRYGVSLISGLLNRLKNLLRKVFRKIFRIFKIGLTNLGKLYKMIFMGNDLD